MPELLPIGSVVLLKEATKKLMIIGILQVDQDNDKLYDYLAVPFPEGYINEENNFLFDHDDIQEVFFTGFINQETQNLMNLLTALVEQAEAESETEGEEVEVSEEELIF